MATHRTPIIELGAVHFMEQGAKAEELTPKALQSFINKSEHPDIEWARKGWPRCTELTDRQAAGMLTDIRIRMAGGTPANRGRSDHALTAEQRKARTAGNGKAKKPTANQNKKRLEAAVAHYGSQAKAAKALNVGAKTLKEALNTGVLPDALAQGLDKHERAQAAN